MIDDDLDRMRDRHNGFLVPPVAHEPAIPGRLAAVFHSNGSQCGFRQSGAQPAVPFPCLAARVFACTFLLAGTVADG
jgi:hypothetical protein